MLTLISSRGPRIGRTAPPSDQDEVASRQYRTARQRRELHGRGAAGAVGVVKQRPGRRMVDVAVVCVLGRGGGDERAGQTGGKDCVVEPDLVGAGEETVDAVDIAAA